MLSINVYKKIPTPVSTIIEGSTGIVIVSIFTKTHAFVGVLHQQNTHTHAIHQRVRGNPNACLRYNKMKHSDSNSPQRIYKDRL